MEGRTPLLPIRAWKAWRERGTRYACHKALRRVLEPWPELKRRFAYSDPQSYWTLRGGRDYFREQEDQPNRTIRSEWLAERIASYHPQSILEIGCGYGKQLYSLASKLDQSVQLVGVDFSPTQLAQAEQYLQDQDPSQANRFTLALASGERLPFPDKSFDLVLTSAVILHNPPEIAERIRREVIRVARKWAAHNEDINITYNRYGYDTGDWYRRQGYPLVECGPIPLVDPQETAVTQFCVVGPLG